MITDLLNDYGIDYVEQGKNVGQGWIGFACPFHNDPSHHLGYNLEGNFFSCWNCGSISTYDVLQEWGIPYEQYKAVFGTNFTIKQQKIQTKGKFHYPEGWQPTLLPAHKNYLKGRGFSPNQLVKMWKIGGIGLSSRLAWRIFIPVLFQGQVVSWTTRSMNDKGARYINAKPEEETLPIKSLLFGHDHVRHSCIVVEGPLDVMRIGPGAVGLMGTMYTKAQVAKLSKIPYRAIAFDNEPKAQRKAQELAGELSVFPGRTSLVTIDAPDPGSMKPKDVSLIRKEFLDG